MSTLAHLGGSRIIANGTIKLAVFFEVEGGRNILGEDDAPHDFEEGAVEEEEGVGEFTPPPLYSSIVLPRTPLPLSFLRYRRSVLSASSGFMTAYYERRGYYDVQVGEWESTIDDVGADGDSVAHGNGGSGAANMLDIGGKTRRGLGLLCWSPPKDRVSSTNIFRSWQAQCTTLTYFPAKASPNAWSHTTCPGRHYLRARRSPSRKG
jgi:hypothetical protein